LLAPSSFNLRYGSAACRASICVSVHCVVRIALVLVIGTWHRFQLHLNVIAL
jgi:hypothetical protein